jgi:hypothetical protein
VRRAWSLALLVLAACIQIPDEATPQCYQSSDCNQSAGEVCDEGICYGDPPSGTFGISISPPADRPDLTNVERAREDLPSAGLLNDLTLEAPVAFTGTISIASCAPPTAASACPIGAIGATITVTRPARFVGGDGIVLTNQLVANAGTTAFSIPVPRTQTSLGDADYTVTVVPNDRGNDTGSASAPLELVPPLRTTVHAVGAVTLPLALGSGNLTVLHGDLTDNEGTPLVGYRVAAIGRWRGDDSDREVSSVSYSQDGHYSIELSAGVVGTVTIVAKPAGTTQLAPTLQVVGVDSTRSSTQEIVQPLATGTPRTASLTIEGTSTSGEVGPLAGALVIATATLAPQPLVGLGSGSGSDGATPLAAQAVITAQVATGSDGVAELPLLDGSGFTGAYHLVVVPPLGSSVAVLENDTFDIADATLLLKPRVALQGTVVDTSGNRVGNVSVTARPSLRFTWMVDPATQLLLAQIPAATAVTLNNGVFVVYVDAAIAGVAGGYDIAFEPPSGSTIPTFTISDFAIPSDTMAPASLLVSNGSGSGSATALVELPAAAALHGVITDPTGMPVEGGELRVFRVPSATDAQALCKLHLPYAPADCAVPAELQAHATADASGIVRFTLPRSP